MYPTLLLKPTAFKCAQHYLERQGFKASLSFVTVAGSIFSLSRFCTFSSSGITNGIMSRESTPPMIHPMRLMLNAVCLSNVVMSKDVKAGPFRVILC